MHTEHIGVRGVKCGKMSWETDLRRLLRSWPSLLLFIVIIDLHASTAGTSHYFTIFTPLCALASDRICLKQLRKSLRLLCHNALRSICGTSVFSSCEIVVADRIRLQVTRSTFCDLKEADKKLSMKELRGLALPI